jgi:hypothetical protein
MRAFMEDVVPQLETFYGGTGLARSGDFARAISRAAEGVGVEQARGLAGLVESDIQRAFASQEAARDRSLQGIPLAAEEEKAPIRFALNAGQLRRGIASEFGQEALFKELQRSPYANPALGLLPIALGTQAKIPGSGGPSTGASIGSSLGGILAGPIGGQLGGLVGGWF